MQSSVSAAKFCKLCHYYNSQYLTYPTPDQSLKTKYLELRDRATAIVLESLENTCDGISTAPREALQICGDCDYKEPLIAKHFAKSDKKEEKS